MHISIKLHDKVEQNTKPTTFLLFWCCKGNVKIVLCPVFAILVKTLLIYTLFFKTCIKMHACCHLQSNLQFGFCNCIYQCSVLLSLQGTVGVTGSFLIEDQYFEFLRILYYLCKYSLYDLFIATIQIYDFGSRLQIYYNNHIQLCNAK